MTREDLTNAGWTQVHKSHLRNGYLLRVDRGKATLRLRDDDGNAEEFLHGAGEDDAAALADIGTRAMSDGRTVREWATSEWQ